MSFSDIFDKIKCYKLKDDDHIVQEPIQLKCGHSICKKCFLIDNNKTVSCAKCQEVTDTINSNVESAPIKLMVKSVLTELFQTIKKDTTEKLNILKGKLLL